MVINWNEYPTDKNETGHNYGPLYDKYLQDKAQEFNRILEIGSRPGSAKLWSDYFPKASIVCADITIKQYTADWHGLGVEGFPFNQSSVDFHQQLIDKYGTFDVIVDDGPHTSYEQLVSLNMLVPMLATNGVYVIEDMHCTDLTADPTAAKWINYEATIQDVLSDLKNKKYTSYGSIDFSSFGNYDLEVVVESTDRKRWSHQLKPTEIAFIIKH